MFKCSCDYVLARWRHCVAGISSVSESGLPYPLEPSSRCGPILLGACCCNCGNLSPIKGDTLPGGMPWGCRFPGCWACCCCWWWFWACPAPFPWGGGGGMFGNRLPMLFITFSPFGGWKQKETLIKFGFPFGDWVINDQKRCSVFVVNPSIKVHKR